MNFTDIIREVSGVFSGAGLDPRCYDVEAIACDVRDLLESIDPDARFDSFWEQIEPGDWLDMERRHELPALNVDGSWGWVLLGEPHGADGGYEAPCCAMWLRSGEPVDAVARWSARPADGDWSHPDEVEEV